MADLATALWLLEGRYDRSKWYLLEAIVREAARRRAWGEALWTARDLFHAPGVIYDPGSAVRPSG